MKLKILLTSSSFIDTPGSHQELLNSKNFNLIKIRGPLKESELLKVIEEVDAIICGDDELTREVLIKGKKSQLKAISKYGIGLDKIDLLTASELNIPVANCKGVNHTTVAEHVFALLLSFTKNIIQEDAFIKNSQWNRLIGTELFGKKIGIIGTGNVGKEVIKRALSFGMTVIGFDKNPDFNFSKIYNFDYCNDLEILLSDCDILSLNIPLSPTEKKIITNETLSVLKKGVIIVNTARAGLVDQDAIISGIENNIIGGYLTDVLEEEPMIANHPLIKYKNVLITPHIGSRTHENVVKQGTMAVENLIKLINHE